jgi:hypothetical protein
MSSSFYHLVLKFPSICTAEPYNHIDANAGKHPEALFERGLSESPAITTKFFEKHRPHISRSVVVGDP